MLNSHIESTMVRCEDEPIHILGAIQPFGILLSVEIPTLKISNASLNCSDAFGIDAKTLVQRSLAEYLSPKALQILQRYIRSNDLVEEAPIVISLFNEASSLENDWELTAHLRHDVMILELEPVRIKEELSAPLQRLIRNSVHAVFGAVNVHELCNRIAEQIHIITGFDRVMIYRFSEDWHGHVVAEAKKPHALSYLDHHFPASDIPAQARSIFLENWLRMIPDAGYSPVAIYPGKNPRDGRPLDLGLSNLRSVSPLHTEYLRNMQVGSTLTLPLIDNGKLWGLVACHHMSPRTLPADQRLAAKTIVQLASAQLALKESSEDQRYKAQIKGVHHKLLQRMEQEEDLLQGLVKHSPNMLDIIDSAGAAAAIYYQDAWVLIGVTPTIDQIEELVAWISQTQGTDEPYATNQLASVFPPAQAYKDIASGVLAVSILKSERNYMLWFRPGTVSTITWAGEPEKRIQMDNGIVRLHPRLSFNSYKQIVDGVAAPWKRVEIEAVAELRTGIIALDLRRAFKREKAARELAERLSTEKENMVHIVSHDIRNPLSALKMTLQMMQRNRTLASEVQQEFIVRGLRATDTMERLVTSVLDMAKLDHAIGSSSMTLENINVLIDDAVDLTTPIATKAGIRIIAVHEVENVMLCCKRARVEQVLGNLISNALKFTARGGQITVSVARQNHDVIVSVTDTGIGIAPEQLPYVFDRFSQGSVNSEKGAGLGLAIVKDIIEEKGGRIWVESTVQVGTSFHFSLPIKT